MNQQTFQEQNFVEVSHTHDHVNINKSKEPTLSRGHFALLMLLFLIFGSSVTITLKIQNSSFTRVDEDFVQGRQRNDVLVQWQHPFLQTLFMFSGEFLCGIIYKLVFKKRVETEKHYYHQTHVMPMPYKAQSNPLAYSIPAFTDLAASFLVFFGLTQVQASVYQIMKAFIVVYTSILSYMFLRRKQQYYHFIGIFMVVTGVVIVGVQAYYEAPKEQNSNIIVGILAILLGQLFQATHIVIQEAYLKKYDIHQLQLIGWEGTWGMIFLAVLLPIFQYTKCESQYCVNGKIEDTILAFEQLKENQNLLLFCFLYIFSIAIYNGLGITITKYASCVHQAVIDQSRVVTVWAFFIFIPSGVAQEEFRFWQFIGFCIIVSGNIIYNEIVSFKSKNQQVSIDKQSHSQFDRESKESLLQQNDSDYQHNTLINNSELSTQK
eukprot:403336406